jgi:hypothetical protein
MKSGAANWSVGSWRYSPKHRQAVLVEYHPEALGRHGGHGHAHNYALGTLVDAQLRLSHAAANGIEQVELRGNGTDEFGADEFHGKEPILARLRACYDK